MGRKVRAALDVAIAAAAVVRARRTVARTPVGALVARTFAPELLEVSTERFLPDERRVAERWGAAVDRALRWIPGDAACLVRASALRDLVLTRGLPRAAVKIGVRRGVNGFDAHAWVEQDGMPVAEPLALHGAFSPLEGMTVR